MSEIYYQNFIDVPKWDSAQWMAVAFIVDQSYQRIPVLAVVFEDGELGKQIFADWIQRLGEEDQFEELRVALVEGDIPGQEPGYSIQIGSNPAGTIKRAQSDGVVLEPALFVIGSRIHRMHPSPESQNLPMFKDAYYRKGAYLFVPASVVDGRVVPHFSHGIVKKEIHFRHADDLDANDLDTLVLHRPDTDE